MTEKKQEWVDLLEPLPEGSEPLTLTGFMGGPRVAPLPTEPSSPEKPELGMPNFERQFLAFLNSNYTRNVWIETDGVKFYFRKGHHLIDGSVQPCLDLANLTVLEPGQGTFGRILTWIEANNPYRVILVECVQQPRFLAYLERRGYRQLPPQGGFPSVIHVH